MILLIDNYDSFTYNLYQYMGIFEKDIKVVRNDKITIEEIEQLNPNRIVLSPGPKSPKEAGICMDVVKHFYTKKPILGICLGHQSIGAAFGAKIIHAKELMHGKQSLIEHDGKSVFEGIPSPVHVARYHSLAVDEKTLPAFTSKPCSEATNMLYLSSGVLLVDSSENQLERFGEEDRRCRSSGK